MRDAAVVEVATRLAAGPVGSDVDAVLRRCVEALHSVADASDALYFRLAQGARGPTVVRYAHVGSPRARAGFERMFRELSPEVLDEVGSSAFDTRRLRPIETRAFVERCASFPDEVWAASELVRGFYLPAGICDQARLVVVHEGCVVGWLGAFREPGAPPFTAQDRQRLAPLVAPVTKLLVAALGLEPEGLAAPGDLLLDPEGRVELASEAGRAWLALPGFADALRAQIRTQERAAVQVPPFLLEHVAEAHVVRLEDGQRVRYMANVRRVEPIRLPAAFVLSRAEREVAELAAAGATAMEIARHRGSTPGTVRNQLKRVYRILGVGSRLELARSLE